MKLSKKNVLLVLGAVASVICCLSIYKSCSAKKDVQEEDDCDDENEFACFDCDKDSCDDCDKLS